MRPQRIPRTKRDDVSAAEMPPEVAALLGERTPQSAARLLEISRGEDRDQAKAARRALHRLKQSGIEPPAESAVPPPAAPPISVAQHAYLTNVDGTGSQMLVFLQDDPYGGSPWMVTFIVQYNEGLTDLGGRKMPRREIAGVLEEMGSRENRLVVEAPVDYVRHLVQEGVRRAGEARRPLPEGYSDMIRRVGPPQQDYPRPLVYERLDAEALPGDLSISHEPERLFEHPLFRGWLLDVQAVRPWAARFVESQQTRLALDRRQLGLLADRVVEEAADALLAGPSLAAYRRRLEENALLLLLADHKELARQALYQALRLAEPLPPHSLPFARVLTRRTIEVIVALQAQEEQAQEEAQPEGLIQRL